MKVMEALEKALKWYCESAQAVYTPSDWNALRDNANRANRANH